MEQLISYLAYIALREGQIERTIPQIAKALGKRMGFYEQLRPLGVRDIRDRYENQITHTLQYLTDAGYIEHVHRDRRRANQEGLPIVVTLPAGVAQSVRAATRLRTHVRSQRRPACDSPTRELAPPLKVLKPKASETDARASGVRAVALSRTTAAETIRQIWRRERDSATGVRVLTSAPELAGVDLEVFAGIVWSGWAGHPDRRLSPQMRQRLHRAAQQLERVGYNGLHGPAAARAALFDLALGDWRDWWPMRRPQDKPPRTLGGLACCMRRLARQLVCGARNRRDLERGRPIRRGTPHRRRPADA